MQQSDIIQHHHKRSCTVQASDLHFDKVQEQRVGDILQGQNNLIRAYPKELAERKP